MPLHGYVFSSLESFVNRMILFTFWKFAPLMLVHKLHSAYCNAIILTLSDKVNFIWLCSKVSVKKLFCPNFISQN